MPDWLVNIFTLRRSIGLLIQLALLCVLPNFGESQREGLNFMSSGHKHRRLLPDSVGHISAPTRVSGYHCRKCEKKGGMSSLAGPIVTSFLNGGAELPPLLAIRAASPSA